MRALMFGIWAAALAVCLGGCAPSRPEGTALMRGSQPRWDVREAPSAAGMLSQLSEAGMALGNLSGSGPGLRDDLQSESPASFEAIAHRISNDREEVETALWTEYAESSASNSPIVVEPKTSRPLIEAQGPPIEFEVQRSRVADYFNSRLRVALLESKLAAADESERGTLSSRLSRAKSDLEALEEACRAEAQSRTGSREIAVSKPQPPVIPRVMVSSRIAEPDERADSSDGISLESSFSDKRIREGFSFRQDDEPPAHLAGNVDWKKALAETRRSIDRAMAALRDRQRLADTR